MSTIVIDGRTMQDHYPGIGRYVYQLVLALAEIAPTDRFRILYDTRVPNSRFDYSRLTALPNVRLVSVDARAFSLAEQSLAFHRAALAQGDVFHAPYYSLPYALTVPLVVTLEDVTPLAAPGQSSSATNRFIYRVLTRLAAARAKRVITLSEAARADIRRHLNTESSKISVIPLAPSPAFTPSSENAIALVRDTLNLPAPYALYVGSNKPHKNLVRLVEAFSKVPTDARLIIAGQWDARYPEAKTTAERFGLQDKVLFRHSILENELPALMSGARAFVFPSLHEGFGLPPLEAMACGAPVLCSGVSALPEVVGDAAVLFNPLDTDSISNALSTVLEDGGLQARLREKGFERAAHFSWERTARETLHVYRSNENPTHL
jgi:alpha-1,3-rhamnosyl/mannosyltransferase